MDKPMPVPYGPTPATLQNPTCSVGLEGVTLASGVPAPMGERDRPAPRKGGPY